MPAEFLLVLLPLAAASGWWLAMRRPQQGYGLRSEQRVDLASDYFRGINFFLNEQPDKAIDVFVRALEADSSVVEPHLALGSLFRRRGEVERAIRIHQNLIARPTLEREQRDQALFELARDYLQAGLLDRAEGLFRELLERDPRNLAALRHLQAIFEQEKEWLEAVAILQRIESRGPDKYGSVIAQYYCELAEQQLRSGEATQARRYLKRAISRDRSCVRASLLLARMGEQGGNDKAALKFYRRAADQDPSCMSEIVGPWLACHERLGRQVDTADVMLKRLAEQAAIQPVIDYVDHLAAAGDPDNAAAYLKNYLDTRPSLRGLVRLMNLEQRGGGSEAGETVHFIMNKLSYLLHKQPLYHCSECGFESNVLHWQCPGCNSWNTVRAVAEAPPQQPLHLAAATGRKG